MSLKQIDGYKIRMNQKLGGGSYGDVYVAVSDSNYKKVAIKLISKQAIHSSDYLKNAIFQQIKIMQLVKNPNIVQFVDVMQSSNNYYLVQQLCDEDMTKFMKLGKQLTQNQCINMLTQIANGFLALVRQGIIHRDLKPANIMIKDHILKIGDFGFAKKIPNQRFKNKTMVGTPLYMSLQMLKNEDYTSKCDIWALGCIFYELLHGSTPWTARSEYQLVQNITTKPLNIKRNDLKLVTIDFIKRTLALKEQNRISWDEFFMHPIFNGFFQNKGINRTFQNKLKQIMNQVRFYIKSNNLDLSEILYSLGYCNKYEEMDFDHYFKFLRTVNPQISRQEALYVFRQTDKDNSNSISIFEIQKILRSHEICFTSAFVGVQKLKKKQRQDDETFIKMSQGIQKKMQGCFSKLFKIIVKYQMTLQKVFNDFDKQKVGKLSEKQFIYMMKKLDKNMSQDQILKAFNIIDENGSNTIEFYKLNKYYCKVNGISDVRQSSMNQLKGSEQDIINNLWQIRPQYQNPMIKFQKQNSLHKFQYKKLSPKKYCPSPQKYPQPPPQRQLRNFIMQLQYPLQQQNNGKNKIFSYLYGG